MGELYDMLLHFLLKVAFVLALKSQSLPYSIHIYIKSCHNISFNHLYCNYSKTKLEEVDMDDEDDKSSPVPPEEKKEETKDQIDSSASPTETALQKKQRELIEQQRKE